MIRALKTACTANLVLATGLVFAYVAYGLSAGLPIDQYFLGVAGPWKLSRGSGPKLPGWMFYAVFGAIILVTLIVGLYARWNMRAHRCICGVFGSVFVLGSLIHLPQRGIFEDETVSRIPVGIPAFDHDLALYVWASFLAYALIGPKVKRAGESRE